MQRAAYPFHVRLMMVNNSQNLLPGKFLATSREVEHLGHHQEHHQPAVGVDRRQAGGGELPSSVESGETSEGIGVGHRSGDPVWMESRINVARR